MMLNESGKCLRPDHRDIAGKHKQSRISIRKQGAGGVDGVAGPELFLLLDKNKVLGVELFGDGRSHIATLMADNHIDLFGCQ
jgi:hypothetical protein